MKDTLQAQEVRDVIRQQIDRREKRIAELRLELKKDINTSGRLHEIVTTMDLLDHSIGTLIELEHVLRLCDCPDEAYERLETEKP